MVDNDKWTPLPVPENAPAIPSERIKKIGNDWVRYKIDYRWPYKNQMGQTRLYVVRYETPEGKETPQMTLWCNESGKMKWRFKGIPGLRPLYNLDKIAHSPNAQVIVVEGEKCAEAFQTVIESAEASDNFVVTCWIGGTNAVSKTDWSPLRGRKIILWPDNDEHGKDAMYDGVNAVGPTSKFLMLKIPDDKPKAWDVADAIMIDGWTFPQIFAFIKQNKFKPELPDAPAESPSESKSESEPLPTDEPPMEPDTFPFRCLGYDGEFCYYLPSGTRQVMNIKRNGHTPGDLRALAPLQFWEKNYPGKQGPSWASAGNSLLRVSEKIGIYDPDRQRGRGAWFDKGRSVLHLGDKLLVDGNPCDTTAIESRYVYEAGAPLENIKCNPLSKIDAHKLQEISDMLFWQKPIYSKYLAGWCVIACICGALRYRPHIWLTAQAGTGKTTIIEEIVRPILGDFGLSLASDTTEAGIRQTLGNDALAVMIDEFEGESWDSQQRQQNIIKLARQAFSDNGARIVKGGQNNKAISFQIRSSFFMSSIGVAINQHADETRVSVLTLVPSFDKPDETKEQHFARLGAMISSVITDDWCSAFRLRAIKMIPIIRKNINVFTGIVAQKIGNRRAGDQVGALIAGAYSLTSDNIISEEMARKWVDAQDWTDQKNIADKSDERACLNQILEATIKHPLRNDSVSISELLEYLQVWTPDERTFTYEGTLEAQSLKRLGIRYERDEGMIYFSDSHRGLKALLKETAWPKSWARLLKRIPGSITRQMRFGGLPSLSTGLPWGEVMGDEEIPDNSTTMGF